MHNKVAIFCLAAAILPCGGQNLLESTPLVGPLADGFHIYQMMLSFEYTSLVGGLNASAPSALNVGPDYTGWAGGEFAYTRNRARTHFSILYEPLYFRSFRFSSLHGLNQVLHMEMTRQVTPQWALNTGLSAEDITIEQFLFSTPHAAGPVLSSYPNEQAPPSGQTGLTAIQAIIYGQRVLTISGRLGVTYKPTSRFRVTFDGEGSDSRARPDQNQPVPQAALETEMETAELSLAYSTSPRSEAALRADTQRLRSFGDTYTIESLGLGFTHRFTPHLIGSVLAGGGVITPLRAGPLVSGGSSWIGEARLGYEGRENVLSANYSHFAGDFYGLGASSTTTFAGNWSWRRLGLNWGLHAYAAEQILSGGLAAGTRMWQASGGVSRAAGRQLVVSLDYSYLTGSFSPVLLAQNVNGQAARLTFSWIPFLRDAPPLGLPRVGAQ